MKRRDIFRSKKLRVTVSYRKKRDACIQSICFFCSGLLFLMVFTLLFSLFFEGMTAFLRTKMKVGVFLDGNSQRVLCLSKKEQETHGLSLQDFQYLFSSKNAFDVGVCVPQKEEWFTLSSDVDLLYKSRLKGKTYHGKLNENQLRYVRDKLVNKEIKFRFNKNIFLNGDSVYPELAGILTGLLGSFMTIIISILFFFPIGIATGIYISEFARHRWFSMFVELIMKNLASTPSIVIGIFGLSFYIGILGMPKSSALVGGLTLGVIALPLITITTKQALQTVPNSIKYAALALGASQFQVLIHHQLPIAFPMILTGLILSIARIMGETAPLLVVGMVIFVRDIPSGFLSPVTSLPVQIYLWAKNPSYGFEELTSATVVILILIISSFNLMSLKIKRNYKTRILY